MLLTKRKYEMSEQLEHCHISMMMEFILTLSGLGGGGLEAWMTKLTAANQKPLTL